MLFYVDFRKSRLLLISLYWGYDGKCYKIRKSSTFLSIIPFIPTLLFTPMKLNPYFESEVSLQTTYCLPLCYLLSVPIVLLEYQSSIGDTLHCFLYILLDKVFESYYYILTSISPLLRTNKTDYSDYPVIKGEAKNLKHIVIVPIYSEPYDVIAENIDPLLPTIIHTKRISSSSLRLKSVALVRWRMQKKSLQIFQELHPFRLLMLYTLQTFLAKEK